MERWLLHSLLAIAILILDEENGSTGIVCLLPQTPQPGFRIAI
jgi:hypothetical protein